MATKRTPPKAKSKTRAPKTSNGRAAVEKGRSFEDQVADLYRLLGARVTQNIEIHQKKVDLLATFRQSADHAFKSLLDIVRSTGVADSADLSRRERAVGSIARPPGYTRKLNSSEGTRQYSQAFRFHTLRRVES
jgi:hypothetical protein